MSSYYPAAVLRITPTCYNKSDPILASRSPLFLLNSPSLPPTTHTPPSFSLPASHLYLYISVCLRCVFHWSIYRPARKPNIYFFPNNHSALKMIYEPFNNKLHITPIGIITSSTLIVSKPHKMHGTTSQQSFFPKSNQAAYLISILQHHRYCPDAKAAM